MWNITMISRSTIHEKFSELIRRLTRKGKRALCMQRRWVTPTTQKPEVKRFWVIKRGDRLKTQKYFLEESEKTNTANQTNSLVAKASVSSWLFSLCSTWAWTFADNMRILAFKIKKTHWFIQKVTITWFIPDCDKSWPIQGTLYKR